MITGRGRISAVNHCRRSPPAGEPAGSNPAFSPGPGWKLAGVTGLIVIGGGEEFPGRIVAAQGGNLSKLPFQALHHLSQAGPQGAGQGGLEDDNEVGFKAKDILPEGLRLGL